MRFLSIVLASGLFLSGCKSTAVQPDAPALASGKGAAAGSAATTEATMEERMARWEQEWQEAKETVAATRDQAIASGETVPPEVDREVTDLLNLTVADDKGDETRIEDLQDAVSDALRLAEILSIG